VAEMAVNANAEPDLIVKPAGHLFGKNVARVAFKRSAYLRNFIYTFTELISPRLTRELVSKALAGYSDDFSL
jgi:LysR family transcriptional regulator, cys regulon transcriptional activator